MNFQTFYINLDILHQLDRVRRKRILLNKMVVQKVPVFNFRVENSHTCFTYDTWTHYSSSTFSVVSLYCLFGTDSFSLFLLQYFKMDPVIYDSYGATAAIDHVEYCFQVAFDISELVVSYAHLHNFVTIDIEQYNAHSYMHKHSVPDCYLLILFYKYYKRAQIYVKRLQVKLQCSNQRNLCIFFLDHPPL